MEIILHFDEHNLPDYPFPGTSDEVYACGCGLCDDINGDFSDESYMRIVRGTTEAAFLDFCALLSGNEYTSVSDIGNGSGIYREYEKNGSVLYTYYIFCENTVRIIADNASCTTARFCAHETPASGSAGLMQFGLLYLDMIRGTTCDCGMLYAIKLKNGKLILIDGGEKEQCTVPAVREAVKRLRELCGSEKITVALWFCTHPHNDHIDMFTKLLRDMGESIVIERVMFNFPHLGTVQIDSSLESVSRMKSYIKKHSPDALFLKPHTGECFNIYGAEIFVLHTHEDMIGYYDDKLYRGANQTSTVIKITVDGVSLILLGDCEEENGEVFLKRYSEKELTCTFLQAAHHCINENRNIYEAIKAQRILIPQSMYNIGPRFFDNFSVISENYGRENITVAGDGTSVFTIENGTCTDEKTYPVIGTIYDENEL